MTSYNLKIAPLLYFMFIIIKVPNEFATIISSQINWNN